jgi:hypothetical protein
MAYSQKTVAQAVQSADIKAGRLNSIYDSGTVAPIGTLHLRGYTSTSPNLTVLQPAPSVAVTAHTMTIAEIMTGIFTQDPTTDRAWTLPTAVLVDAGIPSTTRVNDSFDFSVINIGSASANEIITISAGTDGTLVGSGAILTANPVDDAFSSGSGLFRLRITSRDSNTPTYTCYRIA